MNKLFVVSTPIGNLEDITLRAITVLKEVDLILCEDTRRTNILLSRYSIKKALYVFEQHREEKEIPNIINLLKQGKTVALVSDAGTPSISDPGFKLIRECIKQNIQVVPIPGSSAAITALTASGLPTDKFFFVGFLPQKPSHAKVVLEKLKSIGEIQPTTFIIFESPYHILKTLLFINETFGDKNIVIARELTKVHEDIKHTTVDSTIKLYSKTLPKGEITILFHSQY